MPEKNEIEIHFSGTLTEEHLHIYHQYCLPTWLEFFSKYFKWLFWFYLGLMIVKALRIPGYIPVSPALFYDIFILWLLSRKRQIKKILQSNKLIQGNFSGVAREQTLFWDNHLYGLSKFSWNKILKYQEAKNIIMLYTGINQALIVPRSFFNSEEDWQQFRQLVADKVTKK
ncbi:hypothetical protein Sta7437_2554 [Stanieria cyanosphaera PCC 7437]|uniref:YcxB-like C-terminal domain-containing protein n=1 Tax=Stanieria cyanosphaera (strain ATCC 29371 / PCC 7437) TaxID=111780 RepID=K9XVI4_STAC7|nr:YcxB family protein [Stanieria cyanosphaera]AFZ36086.1 hypothetical protein Sta7437_2554 [Stanieria cyanosphaera PCC 7437]